MTWLVQRMADLRRHLDHLKAIRPKVDSAAQLAADLSLQNDVLHSLLMVCQLVIDVAGELASARGERFEDYRGAIRALESDRRFPTDLVRELEPLAGFRNVVIHEYVGLDLERVVDALENLDPVERFFRIAADVIRPDL